MLRKGLIIPCDTQYLWNAYHLEGNMRAHTDGSQQFFSLENVYIGIRMWPSLGESLCVDCGKAENTWLSKECSCRLIVVKSCHVGFTFRVAKFEFLSEVSDFFF